MQNIFSKTSYEGNVKHGKEMIYFSNGYKMREGFYDNGNEQGERIWWNEKGIVTIKEHHKAGELNRDRFIYDDDGTLEIIQKYKNGEQIA